jgi:hypothetical protein
MQNQHARPARYKMEWIYTRTKVSGQVSLELALKERKKERENAIFSHSWFRHSR